MPRSTHPQTLGHEITISGRGLHGNRPCTVRLVPVDSPSGLRFVHLPTGTEIPVKAALAGDMVLSTTLVKDGVRLQTIEHLLSALMGLEVEHLRIEVNAEELPILDGSAGPWVEAILQAGMKSLDGRRRFLKITRPVEVRNGDRWIRVSPFDGLRLRYTIDFPVPALGRQSRELSLTPEKYRRELGAARTFCLAQEIEAMRARGLALGGSLDNAVVFGNEGPLNESLRFEDEAVRHKMLDLVGDLALLGAPMLGLVEAHAAGHALHVGLAQAILADPSCWEWTVEAVPANVRFFFQPSQSPVALPA
jgi:UDP-3-O-[3-hydroxymyristoyl] N-acetylglucosamine deacetylase